MIMKKLHVRKIAKQIDITRYLDYRDYLAFLYKSIKDQDDSYSYIKFTEHLGLGSCNAMHLIIHGKRPLTPKAAKKITESLAISGKKRQYFIKLVELATTKNLVVREKAFEALLANKSQMLPSKVDKKNLEFYKHWYHAAILELFYNPDTIADPEWLAKMLVPNISPAKAQKSLNLLQELNLLASDETTGKLHPTTEIISTGAEVYDMAIAAYHHEMIHLAKNALTNIPASERDISGLTLLCSEETQKRIKAEIELFRKKIIQLVGADTNKEHLTQINIQMFPLSKKKGRK